LKAQLLVCLSAIKLAVFGDNEFCERHVKKIKCKSEKYRKKVETNEKIH